MRSTVPVCGGRSPLSLGGLSTVAMRRIGKVRLWKVLIVSAILGVCGAVPVYVRIPQQCVLCRAERSSFHLFGISFSGGFRDDSEFARWYVTHRPPHDHIWHCSHTGCLPDRNFLGVPVTLYMMRGHPVLHLRPSLELQFVKRSDHEVLSQFFADAASTNTKAQLRAADTVRKRISEMR